MTYDINNPHRFPLENGEKIDVVHMFEGYRVVVTQKRLMAQNIENSDQFWIVEFDNVEKIFSTILDYSLKVTTKNGEKKVFTGLREWWQSEGAYPTKLFEVLDSRLKQSKASYKKVIHESSISLFWKYISIFILIYVAAFIITSLK